MNKNSDQGSPAVNVVDELRSALTVFNTMMTGEMSSAQTTLASNEAAMHVCQAAACVLSAPLAPTNRRIPKVMLITLPINSALRAYHHPTRTSVLLVTPEMPEDTTPESEAKWAAGVLTAMEDITAELRKALK